MTDIDLELIPGPFDEVDPAVTVATPSCCCCCCCLVSILGHTSFVAAESTYRGRESERNPGWAIVLALASFPLGVVVAASLDGTVGTGSAAVFGLAVMWLIAIGAYASVGMSAQTAAATGGVGVVLFAAAFAVEIPAALVTFFILELVSPFAIYVAIRQARRRHVQRVGPSPPSPTDRTVTQPSPPPSQGMTQPPISPPPPPPYSGPVPPPPPAPRRRSDGPPTGDDAAPDPPMPQP